MFENAQTEPISLQPRVRFRSVGEDGVLLHLDTGRVLIVNEVGLRIVELLRDPMCKSEVAEKIAEEFDVSVDQAEIDLCRFLQELDTEEVLISTKGADPN